MPAHPVVVCLQSVEADSDGMEPRFEQGTEAGRRESEAVGHHAPWESLGIDFGAACFQVVAHEGFAARDDDKDLVGVCLGCHAVEHAQEVGRWHVGLHGCHFAVAATVTAMQVAAQGTLPEELPQGVLADDVVFALSP